MKKPKKPRRHIKSWIMMLLSCLVLLGPVAGLGYREVTDLKPDEQGCLTSGKPRQVLLVLIDQSDPFDSTDRERVVSAQVKGRLRGLEQYDRAVVMALNAAEPASPHLLFQRCAPKNPAHGQSIFDRLIHPPGALEAMWTTFESELDAALQRGLQEPEQPTTPLLETLIAVAKDPELRGTEERNIMVFSDMLQNSRWLSFYKTRPDISRAKAMGIPVEANLFGGASVLIHHITRYEQGKKKTRVQSQEFRRQVKAFWDTWLTEQGARVVWSDHVGEAL